MHWRAVAAASAVSVLAIDWTTTGAPPPTWTGPTRTPVVWCRGRFSMRPKNLPEGERADPLPGYFPAASPEEQRRNGDTKARGTGVDGGADGGRIGSRAGDDPGEAGGEGGRRRAQGASEARAVRHAAHGDDRRRARRVHGDRRNPDRAQPEGRALGLDRLHRLRPQGRGPCGAPADHVLLQRRAGILVDLAAHGSHGTQARRDD